MSDRTTLRMNIDAVQSLMDDTEVSLPENAGRAHLQELLFLLDELMTLHDFLDKKAVPVQSPEGFELTLNQRVALLAVPHQVPRQLPLDFYGKPLDPPAPEQPRMF